MSPDPLSPSQREALHDLQMKHLRERMSNSIRVAVEIEALEKRALRWAIVAFVAVCLAAIFAVLFVRARAEKVTGGIYCVLKDSEWKCGDDPEKLEAEVAPTPASDFGTIPSAVIL